MLKTKTKVEKESETPAQADRIADRCRAVLRDGEQLEKTASIDLTRDGSYTDGAVCLTDQRLIIFSPDHADGHLDLERDAVKKISVVGLYGNYLLQITRSDQPETIGRFTNRWREDVERVCRSMGSCYQAVGADSGNGGTTPGREQNRCPSCGRTLPRKNATCPYCIDKRKVINRLLAYIQPHKKLALLGLLFSLIATTASLAPPYFTRVLVDDVVLARNLRLLWTMVSLLLITHLVHGVFNGLRAFHVRVLAQKVVYDIRTQVFAKMQRLSVNYFDKRSTGAIMSRISNDTQQLQSFIIEVTRDVIVQILTLLIIGVVMFSMHWQLALITLIPIPLVTLGARIFARKIHPVYHRVWRRRAHMNAILGDSIPGIRVIKAFTGEERQEKRFASTSAEFLQEQIRAAHMASIFSPTIGFFMMLSGIIIWGLGGYWVITQPDRLSLGVLVAFISYAWRFFAPVQFLARLSDMVQQATTSAERVFEILDDQPEPNLGEKKVLEQIKGEVNFRHVSFSYDQDNKVLDNINLVIKPGETIGIVGTTGSGKTTIANLFLRFYEPDEGQILLDGTDIRDLDIHYLREHTGFVLQEPLLFRDTIGNNIAYSKPEATTDEILQAAVAANAHAFIQQFPDAYDTFVGERGVGLSGGEKQRISIARAIIKDPAILILDEATASVDTETEQLIQEAINRLIEKRTTLIIAHRLSTLKKADRIIVMDKGRIAEAGTHDELMDQKGIFYRLIKMQMDLGADMIRLMQEVS